MRSKRWVVLAPAAAAAGFLFAEIPLRGEPPADPVAGERPAAAAVEPVTVAEARGQARALHATYESTLLVIHRRYYDAEEKDVIPARALEDVFEAADAGTGRVTRWIAVNTPPMNVDHEPRDGFEKEAATALSAGAAEFEAIDGGVYRRAGAVTLVASCLRCHESGLTKQIGRKRVAALVIETPVRPAEASK